MEEAIQKVQRVLPLLGPYLRSPTARTVLGVVLGYNILKIVNRVLSSFVLNNWTSDKYDWSREIVLLTGGCGGIGQSVAADLASRGIKVIITDIKEPSGALPPNMYFYKCDITSVSNVQELGAQIRKDHGDVTVLVNNAGVGINGRILTKPEKLIRAAFEVNTISHWWLVREFVPAMIKANHGNIVTIASVASFMGLGIMVDYSCSKASALAFYEGLTQELRIFHKAYKIRTSIVHPIWVKTDLIKPMTDTGVTVNQPILNVKDVTKVIVKHILSGNSGQVSIPGYMGLLGMIRGFPNWLQEYARGAVSSDLKRVEDTILATTNSWHIKEEGKN